MADLADVVNAINAIATAAVYPTGPAPAVPIAGDTVQVFNGWPLPTDLQSLVDDFHTPSRIARGIISIYPRTGIFRNTSRWPSIWQEIARSKATITASIDPTGTFITLAGSPPGQNIQNVGIIVTATQGPAQAFVYQTQPTDTLDSIAAALTAQVSAYTTAWNFGPVIQIPQASRLVVRIGVFGAVGQTQRQQEIRVDVNVWTPSPDLRDQVAKPVRQAFAGYDFLTLADGFAARIKCASDHWMDDPEKVGLYRRMISFDVDYPTTQLASAAEIIVFEVTGIAPQPLPY